MLIDTNGARVESAFLLVRTLQPHHPLSVVAKNAIDRLRLRQRSLHLVLQNFMELWVVATRPVDKNGLGMSVTGVYDEFVRLKRFFTVLPGTEEVFPAWERLVTEYQVFGKPAYDARLVAAMQVHGIADILTFDRAGFARYASIEVMHRDDVGT